MGQMSRLPALFAVILLLVLTLGCREGPYAVVTPTPPFTKTFPVVAGDDLTAEPGAGTAGGGSASALPAVFNTSCRGCHADGGGIGPDLKNVAQKTTAEAFARTVRSGKGMMPAFPVDKISDADLNAIWQSLTGGVAPGAPVASGTAAPAKPEPPEKPSTPGTGSGAGATSGTLPTAFNASCRACHPDGGGLGPDLKKVASSLSVDAFTKTVRGGKGMMPAFTADKVSDADVAAIWKYFGGSAAPAGDGSKVFANLCTACHPAGGAGLGPALKGTKLALDAFTQTVRTGKGMMPAFKADRLSDSDLQAVWNYLKELQ